MDKIIEQVKVQKLMDKVNLDKSREIEVLHSASRLYWLLLKPFSFNKRHNMKNRTLRSSFVHAANGLAKTWTTQRNFRIQVIILSIVSIMSLYFKISNIELLMIVFISSVVLITEILNTAVELLADKVHDSYSIKIRAIKDISAGAVLIASALSVVAGLLIFLPHIIK